MFRKLYLLFLGVAAFFAVNAQTDSSRLRISLLTCGTGPEVWETFGHAAIRVVDSVKGTDIAFNYGTFEFGDDFAMQFAKGKLLYYLSYYPYSAFLEEYDDAKRSVLEQVFTLDGDKKEQIYTFLKENSREENRYYKYDFFYDNCATRIREVFPRSLNEGFKFGITIAGHKRLTFRNIINRYYYYKHWERLGINLLLGSPIDKVMKSEDIMFLPDFLRDGIGNATYNGKKIATEPELILPGSEPRPEGINWPLVVTAIISLLTIIGIAFQPLSFLGKAMSFFLLLVTGLLGCLMVVIWLGTDHQGCGSNYNLLWALPTNLVFAFMRKVNKSRYAILAIILMLLALVFHILNIQELPLLELFPLLLALLFVYGSIFKKSLMHG